MLIEYSWFLEEALPYTKLKSGPLVEENRFSNPSPPKINELFEHFGIMNVVGQAIALDHKSDRGSIEKKTAELVEKRNAVAHTGMTIDLTSENVVSYLVYARRLVRGIDTVVGKELERLIGAWPWK